MSVFLNETPVAASADPSVHSVVRASTAQLVEQCHYAARRGGWWTDLATGESLLSEAGQPPKVNVPEKLMLIVSEVAEAMEGVRKGLADDKLPYRPMLEVELADALIRICDTAGGLGLDLPGAVAEKLAFNAQREDHKPANRRAEGGKKF